jgi:hypothetical protein
LGVIQPLANISCNLRALQYRRTLHLDSYQLNLFQAFKLGLNQDLLHLDTKTLNKSSVYPQALLAVQLDLYLMVASQDQVLCLEVYRLLPFLASFEAMVYYNLVFDHQMVLLRKVKVRAVAK